MRNYYRIFYTIKDYLFAMEFWGSFDNQNLKLSLNLSCCFLGVSPFITSEENSSLSENCKVLYKNHIDSEI